MSAAGPVSSVVLGFIFIGLNWLLKTYAQVPAPVQVTIYYIGYINILLAVFNIIPGFPLDGGRVLRSIIWGITKSLNKATMIAGNVGRLFGWAMILLGIALVFGQNIWIFQGGVVNGIWLVFIGWFLASAADNAMREQSLQQQLAGIKVKDVMDRTPECTSPAASVESIVHDSFIQNGRRSLPVCNEKGLIGIVTLADVKKLSKELWPLTAVQSIMTPSPLLSVNQEEDLNIALQVLAKNGLNQIPVMNGGAFAGLLSRSDVLRYLQTRQELGLRKS
jgi:predicted transcriptional regulator